MGAGLITPASLACLSTPLKANRCFERISWYVWQALHSSLRAWPFALKIKKNFPDAFLPAGGIVGKCYRSISSCFSKMSDLFPLSVVFHFPPEVYLSRGVGDLCPLLVRAWHVKKISALQFLRGGRVRVTVREPAYREELLSSDFVFEDRKVPVTICGCPRCNCLCS